jgi:hypothetical protein
VNDADDVKAAPRLVETRAEETQTTQEIDDAPAAARPSDVSFNRGSVRIDARVLQQLLAVFNDGITHHREYCQRIIRLSLCIYFYQYMALIGSPSPAGL